MAMTLLYRADVVANVPMRWAAAYNNWHYDAEKRVKTEKLLALPAGFSAEDVNAIIGNDSWTELKCSECQKNHDVLIQIGDEPDYDARYVELCRDCLSRATLMFA
jgi:hypothetical protein